MSTSTSSIEGAVEVVAVASGIGKDEARPGTHSFVVSGTTFQVDTKYKFIKPIGHGAYGVVISAQNTETGDKVAIKKVSKAFEDLIDAKRILREIKLLQHFDHENIITIVDLLPPTSLAHFEDVYIISDLMETDLHRIIYSRQPLSDDHIQYFLYQILRALKYIHSSNVLHRDLKPSNLLLNSNCDLKVCDFGLARGVEPDEDNMELTEYVVTRWYRAPEIMLSTKEYTKAIDIWSTGCIFAELLGRKPMFPGDDYIHQLQIICDKLGTPSEAELHFVTSEKARRFMKSQPNKPKIPLDRLFPNVKPTALDLLDKMLVFDPSQRISVEEALQHPYLESLHNCEDEPKATKHFSFEFEKENLTKRRLQELIAEEVCHFHPEWRDQRNLPPSDAKLSASRSTDATIDGSKGHDD
ncbi:CMGC/MAPK protein kinase [Aphanomyces invadans]|uniref:Mitogen-activated protein kinase n=1 Tax=Aphanomyces invadans TaxID=157072 RepID=A0A024UEP3_9STRA|nr:CMGC/MAPK protein kinase [Aphanomyces invadans]ETW04861.1 CMGC/MAPK protein kinase [Aphanomyces invadans]|eukprot:XP_008866299.1 CMGC/MAPK protein kinase [Aphanomyces invadans]